MVEPFACQASARAQVNNVGMSATSPTERANQLLFGFNAIKTLVADGQLEHVGTDPPDLDP